jgi:hypothetical protein
VLPPRISAKCATWLGCQKKKKRKRKRKRKKKKKTGVMYLGTGIQPLSAGWAGH